MLKSEGKEALYCIFFESAEEGGGGSGHPIPTSRGVGTDPPPYHPPPTSRGGSRPLTSKPKGFPYAPGGSQNSHTAGHLGRPHSPAASCPGPLRTPGHRPRWAVGQRITAAHGICDLVWQPQKHTQTRSRNEGSAGQLGASG